MRNVILGARTDTLSGPIYRLTGPDAGGPVGFSQVFVEYLKTKNETILHLMCRHEYQGRDKELCLTIDEKEGIFV